MKTFPVTLQLSQSKDLPEQKKACNSFKHCADEVEEVNDAGPAGSTGGPEASFGQDVERVDSSGAAEALTRTSEPAQRHTRGASMGYLVPPELAALTAFLKACILFNWP